MGKLFDFGKVEENKFSDHTIDELIKACYAMGKVKTGALIVIEDEILLNEYVRTGIDIDAIISSQLLINIFEKNTPLHDGAVIVRGDRVVSATCYLPLSDSMTLSKDLGTRHRAAVGISEVSDSLTIVVSEETGKVSIAMRGQIYRNVNADFLRGKLKVSAEQKSTDDQTGTAEKEVYEWQKKILKTLVNNLGFKILAVVLAFILWLVVYNIDDPKKSKTFTTNVTVENASAVTDMNKCYEVLDGTNTVTFTVTGKRSELEKLDDTDFSAVADMNRLIINDKGNKASVPIEISAKRTYTSVSINNKNKYMELSLEDLMSRRFMISADTSGKVASGYALGEVSVTNPNVLNVSGPASIVKKVDKVVATIDVDGMSSNLTDNVIPVLYDSDGNEVDTTQLKLSNTTVTISAKNPECKGSTACIFRQQEPHTGNIV